MYINNNAMSANVANTLTSHYGNLATSTQRLSTGLRINSAADDAAGLAIRELMRSDITAMQQGIRNANDAISLLQTADGALSIIDEKLIRMKELAEQAATGTYDSTQRMMIDSEYQQMASEITRIANATDFNGIHLLNGNLSSETHKGGGLDNASSPGKMKIHFGTQNDSAEDYYYIQIGCATASALGIGNAANTEHNGSTVSTQDAAQKALVALDKAIVSKDKIRAHLGALQNRFENTISNLTTQAENLQAAESRISDVDVATEMTNFVRNQILTQSAVAMLSQANSMPQMAMQLIGHQKVREAASILGLEAMLERKPKQLSGGQRQRVAMGRAIVRNPKVFLMDEPLSNLDAKLRVQMRIEISKLHERLGATIIYVTHDQTEAMTLGTRIVVMKDGVVQQIDTPHNLYMSPGNLFVAGFIGSPQMNFIDAKIEANGDSCVATVGNSKLAVPVSKSKALIAGGYSGKTVCMGIRPEDIHDSQMFIDASPNTVFDAKIRVYELLGAEVFLYFDYAGVQLTARVDPRTTARMGDTVRFAFDMEKAHFFDKETEKAIVN